MSRYKDKVPGYIGKPEWETKQDLVGGYDVWSLMREARQKYDAIEYYRKNILGTNDEFELECLRENKLILEVMQIKLTDGEIIDKPMFQDTTPPWILDYCFSNFSYLSEEVKVGKEIYSPLQILPRVKQFIGFMKEKTGSRFSYFRNYELADHGIVAGGCDVRIITPSNQRNLYFPVGERSPAIDEEKERFFADNNFFCPQGRYNEISANKGVWKGDLGNIRLELKID